MKKVLFVAVLVTAGLVSQAQVKFGLKAGVNLATFSGDDKDFIGVDPSMKIGIAGGGFAHISFSDKFGFQPELLFSGEGAKYEESGEEVKINLGYINVPLMLQYRSSGFYAETGPQIGFLVSAKAKGDGDEEDIKDSFKSTNFSWMLGVGYQTASGFGFGARYGLGLGNIIDADDADLKTSGFHIGVFYAFGGGSGSAKK